MELLFQIILVLALVKYSSKAAFFRHWVGMAAFACCAGLLAVMVYPAIITMESNVFESLLSDRQAVSSVAVLVTIEAISGMLISISILENLFSSKKKPLLNLLRFTPGILIFGTIFYFELAVFRHFAGIRFFDLALWSSIGFTSIVFLAALAIKKALPDDASRHELIFLTNTMLLCLSILFNAGLADYNASSYQAEPEPEKLAFIILVAATGFAIGYLLYNFNTVMRRIRHDHLPPDAPRL